MTGRYDMVGVIVVRAGAAGEAHEFLQLRRQRDDFMGGTWQTIRGSIEPDETAPQAALRELREEAALEPSEFYRLGVETFYIVKDDAVWHCPMFCAVVPREAKVVLNSEHEEFRWVKREEVFEKFMWPSERGILRELCEVVLENGASKEFSRIM